jgi:GDP-L-fucose synthase
MKCLVTGSNGFVGRAFVRRLLDDGHTVAAVDNLSSGMERHDWMFQPQSLERFQLMISDVRAWMLGAGPGSLWAANRFDLIIHCAAIVGGRIKIEEDPLAVATDLSIDAEFFHWLTLCRATKTKVVYFSSSAVYPLELQTKDNHCALAEHLVHFDGTRIGKPDMTYGWAKLTGEYLAKFAVEKYGLDVVIYRPFGGYGEDQNLSYPFPSICKRVVENVNPVMVWGSGDQQRDFIHIDDIVECVLQTKDKLKPGTAMNLGSGIPTSFFDLAELVLACAGAGPNGVASVRNDPHKPEGVFSRVADIHQMMQHYQCRVSLTDGIRRSLESWHRRVDLHKTDV